MRWPVLSAKPIARPIFDDDGRVIEVEWEDRHLDIEGLAKQFPAPALDAPEDAEDDDDE